MTLRAPSRRVIITSGINGRAMRAPYGGRRCNRRLQIHLTVAMMQPSVANTSNRCNFPQRCRGAHCAPADILPTFDFPPQRPPSLREGDRPQAVEGVLARRRWKEFPRIARPITLRAPSRSLLYNPGCRVAILLVSKGVMGFLGDLRGRNSKSPPNPLGLAERVPSSADDDSPTFPKATFIL